MKKKPQKKTKQTKGVTKGGLTLHDLFVTKLQALYDVETQLVKALPKMAKAATDPELKQGFQDHLAETEVHVTRLETAFESLGVKPKKLKVEAIRGLVEDAEWGIGQKPGKAALDALLIASAAYVEHYEMAGYLSACRWAKILGDDEALSLLEATLAEEKAAADTLESMAEAKIDERAVGVAAGDDE